MERFVAVNDLSDIFDLGRAMVEKIGDCPNLERNVNINGAFWKTESEKQGWYLQKNRLTDKARIVSPDGKQMGNGSLSVMKEKMERLLSKDFLRPGDVIGVSRGAYEHYAIYLGNREVIHYAGEKTDFGGRISIHKAPFSEFLGNAKSYFVVSWVGTDPVKIQSTTKFIGCGYYDCASSRKHRIYTPEETIKRAYSRLGETKYSLIQNNCEHFAMWCKTGVAESMQVTAIVNYAIMT